MSEHQAVMLEEAVVALNIKPAGRYIDATFGRGGHAQQILKHLAQNGELLVIDKDPSAIQVAQTLAKQDKRLHVRQGSFRKMREWCEELNWVGKVNGVLMDLGVSSPQLDESERGFSFQHEGPLDMRMDPTQGQSAADWIQSASVEDMAFVFKTYGEERFAKRIAKAIVQARAKEAITTTKELASIIAKAMPRTEKHKHPATRTFQAIRIYINQELDDLKHALDDVVEILDEEGRLAVISFHSLEDRLVKQFIKQHEADPHPSDLPIRREAFTPKLKAFGKSITADENELQGNVRARSARLRVAIKPRQEGEQS